MNKINKINSLIDESKPHTFQNNCYTSSNGTYGRVGLDLQVWFAECEDILVSFVGEDSSAVKLFNKANFNLIEGNHQDSFDEQISFVIAALKVALRILGRYNDDSEAKTTSNHVELDFSKVFIVHGHDDTAKTKVARFVEKLGFEAIILHEQTSSSKTIIEKIEEYSNVGFGIILYTPCDIGGKQTASPELKPRARQNVVFEHGFLIGKIGRNNVCALVKGNVETPNDISGVVYVSMDAADAWRYQIAKEMKKIGYDVDLNKL